MTKKHQPQLCFRCEWRAMFLETRHQARYECSKIDKSVHSCYMYSPIIPPVLSPVNETAHIKGAIGGMLGAHLKAVSLSEYKPTLKKIGKDKYVPVYHLGEEL